MPAHGLLFRVLGTLILIPLSWALWVPVANAADAPKPLSPRLEASELAALGDPSAPVRQAAVTFLADRTNGHAALAKAVAAYLRPEQPSAVKRSAMVFLGRLGAAAVPYVPQIAALLADPDEQVRKTATAALLAVGPRAAEPAAARIATLLKDPSHAVRAQVLDNVADLASLGPAITALAPQAAALLTDSDSHVRGIAAAALGELGSSNAAYASRVAALLQDSASYVRLNAAFALGYHMGATGAAFAPQVAALLKDADGNVRLNAAFGLGHMGAAAAGIVPQILAQLKDTNPSFRGTALDALRYMGRVAAPYALQAGALLTDPNSSVRYSALEAVLAIGPTSELASQVAHLLKDPDLSQRLDAAQYLGKLGSGAAAALPQIGALLGDADPRARAAAVEALGLMGPAAADYAPKLVEMLKDPDVTVGRKAGEAVGGLGSAVLPLLAQLAAMAAESPDASTRVNAQAALHKLGAIAAPIVPQLVALLARSEVTVRIKAIATLQSLGPVAAGAARPLADLLVKESNPGVRDDVLDALAGLGTAAAPAAPEVAAQLDSSDRFHRLHGAQTLKALGFAAAPFVPRLTALLGDANPRMRAAAAAALGSVGPAATAAVPRIAALLSDRDAAVRDAALNALIDLDNSGALKEDHSVLYAFLEAADLVPPDAVNDRMLAYLYRQPDASDQILIRWLGHRAPAERPAVAQLDRERAFAVLQTFNDRWEHIRIFPELAKETAERIAELTSSQSWAHKQLRVLRQLHERLAGGFPDEAAAVQAAVDQKQWYEWLEGSAGTMCSHGLLWTLLIFAYPRSRWVQAVFFWNPWARRFLGFFYVGVLIAVVPWLRRRMLQPFRDSLVPQRILAQLNERAYFPDCEVLLEKNRRTEPGRLPLTQMLASIRGQVVLKGPSGLGKTLLLLRLALVEKEPVVFLRAIECAGGVVAAIQKKVHGQLRDAHYLRALIHAGGLKVLIDGLNEAPPDARARITQFVEEYFKGDCILTTQPISADPPATALVYVLQALLPEQIEPFLLRQWAAVAERATLDEPQYQRAVAQYLETLRESSQAGPVTDPRLLALSNPMDATLAAELLARGEAPDMFRLIEQRYDVMAEAFRAQEGRDFRLKDFAERVYEWRKSGEPEISIEGFEAEVAALVTERLMIRRTERVLKEKGEEEVSRWFFRHDKIMDFFLLPAFMEEHRTRREQHDADEPFWGVYELLAARLPEEEETRLRRFLIDRAAELSSNDLLNRYTLARRLRPRRQDAPAAQPSAA